MRLLLCGFVLSLSLPAQAEAPADLDRLSEAQRNVVLSQGYSQLYDAVSNLRWLDELLTLKFESRATQDFISGLAAYSAELRRDLERLAEDYPSLSLEDDGLPLLERRARAALGRDRLTSLAPLTGKSGVAFERTLLLTQSGALHHLRHLAQVTQEAEKEPQRRAFLARIERRFDTLYRQAVDLLNQRYFCS